LEDIFETHKDKFGIDQEKHLEFIWKYQIQQEWQSPTEQIILEVREYEMRIKYVGS
jgi:hypothetical protein